jgi:SOS-response transcriptional repressor LexA
MRYLKHLGVATRSVRLGGSRIREDLATAHDETVEELARLKASFPTPRDAVAYIMDTFPIIRRKDEEKYNGDYRTRRVILEIYEAMQEAIRTGKPYQTRLDPPPADPRCCHPPREAAAMPVLAEVLPFRRVKPKQEDRYKTCVPLLSLKAAAGAFSGDQAVEFEDWVEVHPSHQLRKGMFVAQVAGKSMEPVISDGSYCLFRYPVIRTRQGKIVLVEYHEIDDPDTGGSYTIKTYESEKVPDEDGGWRHSVIRLLPANPSYQPIILKDVDEGAVRVIAEFVEVLKPIE